MIEQSFGYDENNSFEIDFYPLINEKNLSNCFIAHESNNVLAFIGLKKRNIQINNKECRVNLWGGICTNEQYRGQGIFSKLFEKALQDNDHCDFHFLWSEKYDLYEKFGFLPSFDQHEFKEIKSKTHLNYNEKKYSDLSEKEKSELYYLYEKKTQDYYMLKRSKKDWQDLFKTSSSNLYLYKEDEKIISYFIKNKGADLGNIIHEYSYQNSEQLTSILNYGDIWGTANESKHIISNNNFPLALVKHNNIELTELILKSQKPFWINGIDSI